MTRAEIDRLVRTVEDQVDGGRRGRRVQGALRFQRGVCVRARAYQDGGQGQRYACRPGPSRPGGEQRQRLTDGESGSQSGDAPALDEFGTIARRVATVASAVEPARAAFDRTDLAALRAVKGGFDYVTRSGASDWDGSWPSNIDAMVDRLLSVPPCRCPAPISST